MPDVIEIVFELLDCVPVALSVRIINLSPAGDPRFYEVPEMIKRNCPLIAFGAFVPLRAWADQAHVALEDIPKLRKFIQPQLAQPTSEGSDPPVAFARVNIFILLRRAQAHCSEFKNNERFLVPANPFLLKKNRTSFSDPDEQGDQREKRSANDQRNRGHDEIEQALQIMIWRSASELKASLERPNRIDNVQRHIALMGFVKRFQRVDPRLMELRPDEALQELGAE